MAAAAGDLCEERSGKLFSCPQEIRAFWCVPFLPSQCEDIPGMHSGHCIDQMVLFSCHGNGLPVFFIAQGLRVRRSGSKSCGQVWDIDVHAKCLLE